MRTTKNVCALTLITTMAAAAAAPALAAETAVTRQLRTVASTGLFTVCSDGRAVRFDSLSDRRYTTWWRDGLAVREHRHLDFVGTLTNGTVTLAYSGVWNRDEDLVTGQIRITGGQFRVDLPHGRTQVGAGVRADGNEFKGTGDRFLVDLCAAFGGE